MSSETKAENVNKTEIKERFLECTICNEEFDENAHTPRLLPCLHTICTDCIRKLIQQNHLTCPFCKAKHKAQPSRGAETFPKDNTRRDLLDFLGADDKPSIILCKACDDKSTAKYRCRNCADFLCEQCYKAHRRTKYTKDHKILRLDELKSSPDLMREFIHEGFCKVPGHETVPLKLYCAAAACCKPICYNCAVSEHRDPNQHPVLNIGEVYDEKKEKLQLLLHGVERTQNSTKARKQKVEGEMAKLEPHLKKMEREIDESFAVCSQVLEQRKKRLKEEANSVVKNKFEMLQNQQSTMTNFIERLTTGCRFTEETLKYKDVSGLLEIEGTIEARLLELQEEERDEEPCTNAEIQFSNNRMSTDFESFVNQMGLLSSTEAYPRNTRIILSEPAFTGEEQTLSVNLRNSRNSAIIDTALDVEIEMVENTGTCIEKQTCRIQPGGTDYKMRFTPKSSGPHRVSIKCLGGKLVLGTKEFNVQTKPSQQKVEGSAAKYRPVSPIQSKKSTPGDKNEMVVVEMVVTRNGECNVITYKHNNRELTEWKQTFYRCDGMIKLLRQANDKGLLFTRCNDSNRIIWNKEIPFYDLFGDFRYIRELKTALKKYGIE